MSLPPTEELARLSLLREDALSAGIVVSSPSNPALDGTYPCHHLDRMFMQQEMNHLEMTGRGALKKWPRHVAPWDRHLWKREPFFNNGMTTKKVYDVNLKPHIFMAVEYMALGKAIVAYDAALNAALHAAVNGSPWAAPSNLVPINI